MNTPSTTPTLRPDTLPVLLDTDIGNDIDDAVALAYLLQQPRCDLLGVTTVTGDTQQRAALCEIIAQAAGRTIEIHAGLRGPLLHGPGQPDVPQYEAVRDRPHQATYPADAVRFLHDTIAARPGQVTLLAIGPLTNIAALAVAHPDVFAQLGQLVLMCGVYTSPGHGWPQEGREWNARVDPVATALTYRAAEQLLPGRFVAVGLDVTLLCVLGREECRTRFTKAGGALGAVGALAEVWFRNVPHITFHDPLAAALLFEPSLCTLQTGRATVQYADFPDSGHIRWTPDAGGPTRIAVEVDVPGFFGHYFAVTGG